MLDISQLYAEFAEPYNLWECQLAILHCAGHPDNMLIETVWNNIIEGEMSKSAELSSPNRINIMANKIAVLGKLYSSSQKYFPLGISLFITLIISTPIIVLESCVRLFLIYHFRTHHS